MLLTYKYYDTPEGQDIYKKTFVTSKYAFLSGLGAATFDVLMFSHPKGIVNTIGRYGWYIGPMVGMATAFTVTTNVAQRFRGKNDRINYFMGGVAAGSIFGTWARSITVGVPAALILGAIAIVKKTGVDEGWEFIPYTALASKDAVSAKHDWTWVPDIPELKTWTTAYSCVPLLAIGAEADQKGDGGMTWTRFRTTGGSMHMAEMSGGKEGRPLPSIGAQE